MPMTSMFVNIILVLSIISTSCAFFEPLLGHHGVHSNPDVFCIMEHCASQSAACMGDSNCRSNMLCITKCGMSNNTCMYRCLNTYDDAVFDSFMKCLVEDYHCLQLVSPDPTFRCSPPEVTAKNFSLEQLKGSWYIVLGLNREYDCFDCQISSYAPTPNSKNFTLTERYNAAMLNGTIRQRHDVQQVEQTDIFNGGKLDYTSAMMGITMYEKWQVIDYAASGKYIIMYYCGHMASDWWFEGSVIYSRNPTLSGDDLNAIADTLETSIGHTIDEYCQPKTQGCKTNISKK